MCSHLNNVCMLSFNWGNSLVQLLLTVLCGQRFPWLWSSNRKFAWRWILQVPHVYMILHLSQPCSTLFESLFGLWSTTCDEWSLFWASTDAPLRSTILLKHPIDIPLRWPCCIFLPIFVAPFVFRLLRVFSESSRADICHPKIVLPRRRLSG
jgi:hypothetical protein